MPEAIAASIAIADPPSRRENTALKFFFTVPVITQLAELAAALGGEILPAQWRGAGFVACNDVDPEGNVSQLRERVA